MQYSSRHKYLNNKQHSINHREKGAMVTTDTEQRTPSSRLSDIWEFIDLRTHNTSEFIDSQIKNFFEFITKVLANPDTHATYLSFRPLHNDAKIAYGFHASIAIASADNVDGVAIAGITQAEHVQGVALAGYLAYVQDLYGYAAAPATDVQTVHPGALAMGVITTVHGKMDGSQVGLVAISRAKDAAGENHGQNSTGNMYGLFLYGPGNKWWNPSIFYQQLVPGNQVPHFGTLTSIVNAPSRIIRAGLEWLIRKPETNNHTSESEPLEQPSY
jgi:hypothetical protein